MHRGSNFCFGRHSLFKDRIVTVKSKDNFLKALDVRKGGKILPSKDCCRFQLSLKLQGKVEQLLNKSFRFFFLESLQN